SRNCS
ncbi:hypothetical protein CPC197_0313B, partial [Chlamydia psittaci C1/97]